MRPVLVVRVPRCPRRPRSSAGRSRRPPRPRPASSPRPAGPAARRRRSSSSDSPSPSSWNWPITRFPARAVPPGYPRSRRSPLIRDALAADRVGGHQPGPVGEDPLGEEPDGSLQQRVGAVGGDRQARVALVADPGVPVVVVPPAFQAFGQRGGRGGDHRAAARGKPLQDGVGVAGVPRGDQVRAVRHHGGPGFLGGRPGLARLGRRPVQRPVGQLQDQVVVAAGGQRHGEGETVCAAPGPGGAGPAEPDRRRCARLQHPPARDRPVIRLRPNPARTSSSTSTRVGPSTASIRRRITALCGSAGLASASRHSVCEEPPPHRLRQMRLPVS